MDWQLTVRIVALGIALMMAIEQSRVQVVAAEGLNSWRGQPRLISRLSAGMMALVALLRRRAPDVVSYTEIEDGLDVTRGSIYYHAAQVRRRLGRGTIETLHGVGLRWRGE